MISHRTPNFRTLIIIIVSAILICMQTKSKPTFELPSLPAITRYACKPRDRFIVAPNAFPFLLLPVVAVVRHERI